MSLVSNDRELSVIWIPSLRRHQVVAHPTLLHLEGIWALTGSCQPVISVYFLLVWDLLLHSSQYPWCAKAFHSSTDMFLRSSKPGFVFCWPCFWLCVFNVIVMHCEGFLRRGVSASFLIHGYLFKYIFLPSKKLSQ